MHIAILTSDESDGYNYAVLKAIPSTMYLYIEKSTETKPFYDNGAVNIQSNLHDGYCGELILCQFQIGFVHNIKRKR